MKNYENSEVIDTRTTLLKNILKTIIVIILTILILSLIQLISRISILIDMANKTKLLDNIDNYYAKCTTINGSSSFTLSSYCKGNTFVSNVNNYSISDNSINNLTMYQNNSENEAIYLSNYNFEKKQAQVFDLQVESSPCFKVGLSNKRIYFDFNSLNNFITTLKDIHSISTVYLNGKSCYSFQLDDGSQIWLDKETALPVKEVLSYSNEMSYYEYSLNSVTDENIQKPDITGYEIR